MNSTSLSLIDRLKIAAPGNSDWKHLQDIYSPLIQCWLSRVPGIGHEINDLTQEVLIVLIRELPKFERRHDGAFRAWLRQITANRIRTFQKVRQNRPQAGGGDQIDFLLSQLDDSTSDLSRQWDQEHDRHVLQNLLSIVKADFDSKTWRAFTRFALEGAAAADVAQELGISVSAVVQAKFRILKRLREEAGDLTG